MLDIVAIDVLVGQVGISCAMFCDVESIELILK